MSLPVYDRSQLLRWFGSATYIKGLSYQDQVIWLDEAGGVLTGEVAGTRRQPYEIKVAFDQGKGGVAPIGLCSCPVGYNCKHVAAALILWMADAEEQQDPSATHRSVDPVATPAFPAVPVAASPTLPKAPPDGLTREQREWLDALASTRDRTRATVPPGTKASRPSRDALAYVVGGYHPGMPAVQLFKARRDKEGTVQQPGSPWDNLEAALLKPPQFIDEADLAILRLLWLGRQRHRGFGYPLSGANGAEALRRIVESGRGFAADDGRFGLAAAGPIPLRLAETRVARIQWVESSAHRIAPMLDAGLGEAAWLTLEPWWYVDLIDGAAGPLELPCAPELLGRLLSAPPLTLDALPALRAAFGARLPELPPPPALALDQARVLAVQPRPVLMLDTRHAASPIRTPWIDHQRIDLASVVFDYQGIHVGQGPSAELMRDEQGALVRLQRDIAFESRCLAALASQGLQPLPLAHLDIHPPPRGPTWSLAHVSQWPKFMRSQLPALRAQGWAVAMDPGFRHNLNVIEEIEGTLREDDHGWFDLELGVRLEGQVLRLEPLLAALFARDARWLGGALERIDDHEQLELHSPEHGRLLLAAGRLKPLVRALIDLFQEGDRLRVARRDSGRLELLEQGARWRFHGAGTLQDLGERLRASARVQPVDPPATLHATLRPYQLDGLAWMQFLRSQALGGVLADDMGLGKTVQTLAHVLVEQGAGRLDRPALILMPTSLIGNWKSEAARFAPGLRVLDLHGPQRQARFAQIPQHDLVLSTYPLVWRDQEALSAHAYHLLILDEAQQVKNASSRAAAAIRVIEARHRLCLTGTPLENHLGELWSQFDFLLPGFLGSQRDFTARWRNPIEKGRDGVRAQLLARRVRPFMLRRRKSDVAAELPPKVETVRSVEFDDAQRDLYETVRATQQRQVLEAVQRQGLGRSHIVLLEALLKLRQVCCDPRLVPGKAGHRPAASAKLDLLLEMLPELVEEGRRILLFSQFTSMLGLISDALGKAGIGHVMLTGDTTDRETPVATFQSGAVPVFLISLRAGGVGLNLTAADTVIHYDPWWNPAVEQQATDRAHRIGQTSTVFVYKLIAAGTVEEKIVAMQQRKSALAGAILGDGEAAGARFTDQDLEDLFAPLPDLPAREGPAR